MNEESSKILSVLSANLFLPQFPNTETVNSIFMGSLILKMFSDILKSMLTSTDDAFAKYYSTYHTIF